MLTLTLRYLESPNGPVLLLSDTEERRLRGQVEALTARIGIARDMDMPEDEALLRAQLWDVNAELAANTKLGTRSDVKDIVVEYAEPTLDDRDAITAALDGTPAGIERAKKAAIERLKPARRDGEPIPYRCGPAVRDACYAAIDFNVSEDRRFF